MAVIRATIERIVREEGDQWVRIFTSDEKIKRLDTKDEERIAQAVAAKGREVGIQYTHREGNINQRTGKPFDNYYFDGIVDEPSTNGDEGIEVVKRQERAEDPRKAWRISLAAGAKLAIASLPFLEEDPKKVSVRRQQEMALAWGYWLFTTPPPRGTTAASEVSFGDETAGSNPLDEPDPYIDDD